MPTLRRFDSDTTHVSDSEPEREAADCRARKTPKSRQILSDSVSPRPHAYLRPREALLDRSNTPRTHGSATVEISGSMDARLTHLESEISQMRVQLRAVLEGAS
jgi:hypothetical protein